MDIVLVFVLWLFALVYLDDIFLSSGSSKDRFKLVRLLRRLQSETGVILELYSGKLFTRTSDYLGHDFRPGHLELTDYMTNAVLRHINATTLNRPRSFQGLRNLSRRFFKFHHASSPLSRK